jgi:outer membrane protein assembly factor BamB
MTESPLPAAAPEQSVVSGTQPSPRLTIWTILRTLFALGVTYGVLIYAWGRTLLEGVLINGRPKTLYAGLLVGGIAVVAVLSARLSQRWQSWKHERRILPAVWGIWWISVAIASWFICGVTLPRLLVIPLFVLSSMWVPVAAWLFYKPAATRKLAVALILCLLAQVGFVALFRVDGVQGKFQVDFNWRFVPRFEPGSELPQSLVADTNVPGPDLTQTTDHDFPQFLGRERSGVVRGVELSDDWTTTPPKERWRIEMGAGWSGFAVVGEHAITQEQRGDTECVVCYSLADGTTEWIHGDPARFESQMGGIGPRATPTVAGGKVYTVGGTGIFNCLDGKTGQALWTVDILKAHQGSNIAHGVSGSPLVVDDLVIVVPTETSGGALVAYDAQTGQFRWHGGYAQASYGSPALAELGGVRQVLLVTQKGIEGNELRTGAKLWHYDWSGDLHVNCSQPVIVDANAGRVFYGTGYGQGCVLLQVTSSAPGKFAVAEVWQSPGKMKTKFTTAVLFEEHLYGLDDGILACVELKTGKQLWKGGRYAHGQVLLSSGLLIVQAEGGDVVLVKPSPQKLIELAKIPALTAKTWNNPALAGNLLLVRNDREAICYELPTRAPRDE